MFWPEALPAPRSDRAGIYTLYSSFSPPLPEISTVYERASAAFTFLSLSLNIAPYGFYRCPARSQQAEAPAPEGFLPQLCPDLRIFLFQQPAAGTLISVDKLTEFTLRLCTEHDMNMINIMVPFFQSDPVIRCYILKYLSRPGRNRVIYHLSSILHNHNQVIIQKKH